MKQRSQHAETLQQIKKTLKKEGFELDILHDLTHEQLRQLGIKTGYYKIIGTELKSKGWRTQLRKFKSLQRIKYILEQQELTQSELTQGFFTQQLQRELNSSPVHGPAMLGAYIEIESETQSLSQYNKKQSRLNRDRDKPNNKLKYI